MFDRRLIDFRRLTTIRIIKILNKSEHLNILIFHFIITCKNLCELVTLNSNIAAFLIFAS